VPTDIFPEIDIPGVSVIWQYTGLSTTEMAFSDEIALEHWQRELNGC
jgi:multidrug efflux pump subunit AcrB